MRALRALRALARAELRSLLRHPGRSLLIALLVAVPVAALAGGAAVIETTRPTPAERAAGVLGAADLRIGGVGLEEARELLPAGTLIEPVSNGVVPVSVPGRRLAARSLEVDPRALMEGGVAAGIVSVPRGRAPEGAGEVALSPLLLEGLGVALGDEVEIGGERALVTGEVLDPENLHGALVLRPRPAQPGALLVDVPDPQLEEAVRAISQTGWASARRAELEHSDAFEDVAIFVIAGLGFVQAALVAAAAFAVGLRRRQREIGLATATGASRATVRIALLLSAGTLAFAGAAFGLGIGLGVATLVHPALDGLNGRLNGPLEISWLHVVGALAMGTSSAVAAAAWPAFTATRLPVRVALSGRRPVPGDSRRWLLCGVVATAGGVALVTWAARSGGPGSALAILCGSVLCVLGLGACSPWLLGRLARHASRLPIALRLAVRDAGRFRARNGPVVTAVLAGLSASVLTAALLTSIEDWLGQSLPFLRADQVQIEGPGAETVARRLARELDAVALAPLRAARLGTRAAVAHTGEMATWIAVGDAELLLAYGVQGADEALDAGRLIALQPLPQKTGGSVRIEPSPQGAEQRVSVAVHTSDEPVRMPAFVVSEVRLEQLGLEAGAPPGEALAPWILRAREPVSSATLERAQALAAEVPGTTAGAERERTSPARSFLFAVVSACFAVGLIVVLIATALSTVESSEDARTLYTVGGSPGLLRAHLAARAAYLALLGGTLAVPGGLLPGFGLLALSNVPLEFSVPWRECALVALGLPAAAYAVTWLYAALRGDPPATRPAIT